MKKFFRDYYPPSAREFKEMWKNGIFIPDTSVLLDLYRYPESTKDALITIFKRLDAQIWIPHQIAHEYYKNRLRIIYDQEDAYEAMCKDIDRSFEAFSKAFDKDSLHHPYIDTTNIAGDINNVIEQSKKELRKSKLKHPKWKHNDTILKELEKIFKKAIGESYEDEKLKSLYSQGEERYKFDIPPGYRDREKPYPDKYGDFIIWEQMIDKAKKEKKPIIFITSEKKPDWWSEINGQKIGVRSDLRIEFRKETNCTFYAYQTANFIEKANWTLDIRITPQLKSELQEIIEKNSKIQEFLESYASDTSQLINSTVPLREGELIGSFGAQGPLTNLEPNIDPIKVPKKIAKENVKKGEK